MQVELLTLNGTKFSGEAKEVQINTPSGAMTVLPHHEPLTAISVTGPVIITDNNGDQQVFATFGGLIEIESNRVRLLSDEAEHSDELIESEIQEALAMAEKLKKSAKDRKELHHAQTLIDRHIVRLEVSKVRRRKRNK